MSAHVDGDPPPKGVHPASGKSNVAGRDRPGCVVDDGNPFSAGSGVDDASPFSIGGGVDDCIKVPEKLGGGEIPTAKFLAELDNHSVQQLLDGELDSLSKPWKGSIPMEVFPLSGEEVRGGDLSTLLDGSPTPVDICDYLGGAKYPTQRLYFPRHKYPPPANSNDMTFSGDDDSKCKCKGWIDLRRDIFIAATGAPDGESKIVSNGKGKSITSRVILCGHAYRTTRDSKAQEVTAENPFRAESLVNNRRNNRAGGKSAPRKRKSENQQNPCTFRFTVKWDEHGFYVELAHKSGNAEHCYHPKPFDPSSIPFPTRFLTKQQKKETKDVVESTTNKAAGRGYLLRSLGRYINSWKIAYMMSRDDEGKSIDAKSDVLKMLDMFESSDEISYVALSDVPIEEYLSKDGSDSLDGLDDAGPCRTVDAKEVVSNGLDNAVDMDCTDDDTAGKDSGKHGQDGSLGTVTLSTEKLRGGQVVNTEVSAIESIANLETLAKEERKERRLQATDMLFIAIAWVVLPAFRFFMLCPEVIWCDVTSHSNNKGFHLLTFSCRTSVDKQVVFLWIWIPNQQRFSFRWVFQHALPKLIPKWLRDRVQFIMKDGDPQQRNEILMALRNIFVNASEGSCGFHIVNMGYKNHVPGVTIVSKPAQARWTKVVGRIHGWIYSWMKPNWVEDDDEYLISKLLLLQFVSSALVLSAAEGRVIMQVKILRWLRGYVFPYENLYLHYRRKHLRHFDTSHSSPHEGTNLGMKNHTAAIQPTMNMDTSAKAINTQQDIKAAELGEMIYSDYQFSHKRWSDSPTSTVSTSFGEGLFLEESKAAGRYSAKRVGTRSFQTEYTGDLGPNPVAEESYADAAFLKEAPIPLFSRVRNIEVAEDGTMRCLECKRFESRGYACRHLKRTADFVHEARGETFAGFTHYDIIPRYLSGYMHLAYQPTTPMHLQLMYHRLATSPISGPKLRVAIPDSLEIKEKTPHLPAIDRLKNYEKADIPDAQQFEGLFSQEFTPDTMSHMDEYELFSEMRESFLRLTTPAAEAMFSTSLDNADLPEETAAVERTRDILKQQWEENCALADDIGPVATRRLEQLGREFKTWCNVRRDSVGADVTDTGSNNHAPGKVVPMTGAQYKSSVDRVFNTHHMP